MDEHSRFPLQGRQVLIVESETKLLYELMAALENDEGAETFYVTDPNCEQDARRLGQWTSSVAILNSAHKHFAAALTVPFLIYGAGSEVPAEVAAIVSGLKAMLAGLL
jgi:hypothetical protein